MKKITLSLLAALALVSCGNKYAAKDVALNDQADSLNYALGLLNGSQLKMYQLADDDSDKAVTEFIDAMQDAYDGKTEELSEAAQMGRNIGMAVKASEKTGLAENDKWTLNEPAFFQGLVNGLNGDTTVMTSIKARMFFQTAYQQSMKDSTEAGKTIKGKCPFSVKTITLKNHIDSVNYAFGLVNGDQMKMYILANDSNGNAQKEFITHINMALKENIYNPQLLNIGQQIGKSIREQEADGLLGMEMVETRFELIKQGFINGLYEYTDQMNSEEAASYIENTINTIKYGDKKAEGEKFLAENKAKEGVITTASGLQYKVIKQGKGAKPAATDRVKVHYHGTLIDGTVFDSSVERKEPIVFSLNQVIAGWTEGLQLMPVGSKYILYIPQELGYGAREAGDIPPYSTLIFEVELLSIEK